MIYEDIKKIESWHSSLVKLLFPTENKQVFGQLVNFILPEDANDPIKAEFDLGEDFTGVPLDFIKQARFPLLCELSQGEEVVKLKRVIGLIYDEEVKREKIFLRIEKKLCIEIETPKLESYYL